MKGYVVSAHTEDKERLYLSDLNVIDFSKSIIDSIVFESIESAKRTLDNRYLSLSYWILNKVKENELNGIYISEMDENNNLWEEKRYL